MSVYRRKKKGKLLKTWWYDFWISGRRYRGSIPEARTKWQAERAETKIRDAIYDGKFGKQIVAPTLREFFDKTYFPWSKANKRSWRHDEFRSRPLLAAMGKKRLDEIGVIQVERYKQDRLKAKTRFTPLSPASINRELELLSGIFTYAIDTGQLIPNPCRKVRRLDEDNERSRYLSQDEEKSLRAQLTGRREHLSRIVTLAIHTLMRKNELLSLRKVNVDFERNVIWVANSRRERTKGKCGRPIPMNSLVRTELLAQCGSSESEYVFPSDSKTGHLEDVKTAFNNACTDAKIKDFHFHDLRRTGATRLAESGADAFYIQALLGHTDAKTSQIYTVVTSDGLRRTVEALVTKENKTVALFPTPKEFEESATAVNS